MSWGYKQKQSIKTTDFPLAFPISHFRLLNWFYLFSHMIHDSGSSGAAVYFVFYRLSFAVTFLSTFPSVFTFLFNTKKTRISDYSSHSIIFPSFPHSILSSHISPSFPLFSLFSLFSLFLHMENPIPNIFSCPSFLPIL